MFILELRTEQRSKYIVDHKSLVSHWERKKGYIHAREVRGLECMLWYWIGIRRVGMNAYR